MIDINIIRKDSATIIELLSRRGKDYSKEINSAKEIDEAWRSILSETEALQQKRNEVSKEIGILKSENKEADPKIMEEMKTVSDKIKLNEEAINKLKNDLDVLLLDIPNIPNETLQNEDRIVREEGKQEEFSFKTRAHWEIGEMLNILDFKAAAKLSGSRFALLKGHGAELERALINYMLDVHKNRHDYIEIMPPYLVKEEIMIGTGQLPKFREDMYITEGDSLCLIPTAEVPLSNIHREEMMASEELPKKYVAYTPCFRREAGSYGKDTSGLIRNHQFNKVELVNIVTSDKSTDFHESLLKESESVLKDLGLTYRVIELGTKELGFSASKTYDLEVWMPGEEKWREVSSCSNCRDFQARRMSTRYKKDGHKEYVHTLNSSGVAVGRIFAAILENFQTEEINVKIPQVLQKYMGNLKIIKRS